MNQSTKLIQKTMQRGLRVITLQGAIEKGPILEKRMIGGQHNYFAFDGSNNIFADCTYFMKQKKHTSVNSFHDKNIIEIFMDVSSSIYHPKDSMTSVF